MSEYLYDNAKVKRTINGLDDFGQHVREEIAEIKCRVKFRYKSNRIVESNTKLEQKVDKVRVIEVRTDYEIKTNDVVVYEGTEYVISDVAPIPNRYRKKYWIGNS